MFEEIIRSRTVRAMCNLAIRYTAYANRDTAT